MKKVTGQSLRLGGMLIEMIGVMGVMTGKGDIASLRLRLPSGGEVSPAWIAVVLGFVIWLVGTIIVASSRSSRPKL
jgi:hypothetical protein